MNIRSAEKPLYIASLSAFCMALIACATTPTPTSQAKPASANLDEATTRPTGGASSLLVKRDTGIVSLGCSFTVTLDGRPAAELNAGEMIVLYAAPGEHILGAKTSWMCSGGNVEIVVSMTATQQRVYRLGASAPGTLVLSQTMN